jgi:outer membrane receptor protein involved in Fe transport
MLSMNKILLTVCFFILGCAFIQAQTSLEGKVKDKDSGEPILFGKVLLYKNGVLTNGTETDLDGNYFFSDLQPGTYDIEGTYLGYAASRMQGVVCKAGQTTRVNIEMVEEALVIEGVVITEYKVPLIEIDNTSQGSTITSEKIATLPQKSINSIVANAAGVSSADGSTPSVRGSRSNETVYFIDGIRTSGTIPQSEVEQLQLVTGGIEAKYGDVSGGVISLTSKGPSREFSMGVEAESSEKLDAFGYNLLSGYVTGPILKNKNKQPIIGFRFSGQYRSIDDDNPSAVGVYAAPLSVIQAIEKDPFYKLGSSTIASAEKLRNADIGNPLKARPNENVENLNITGKLDFRISSNVDISLSGNLEKNNDQFTPRNSGVSESNDDWSFLNWNNNPFITDQRLRLNFRLRHKLGKQSDNESVSSTDKTAKQSMFRNWSYTLLAGYEKGNTFRQDARHEDNFFNYGYFGEYKAVYAPIVGFVLNGTTLRRTQLGYLRLQGDYVPNMDINPVLAKYNNVSNGVLRSTSSSVWTNLYANAGQVYNLYNKGETDLYTFNFSTGLDIIPGSSEKGRHSVQFGVIYEQNTSRAYNLQPFNLWQQADLLVNNPLSLSEIDRTKFKEFNTAGDSLFYPVYEEDLQNKFFYKIREKLKVGERDFVNIHGVSPDKLTLDMFSARELTDPGLLRYRGYDYLGNKTKGKISFEDFFTATEDGRRTFPVAPFSPIYGAAYIQDKFSYKDIIFRLGVRADYYDANTKVLKDPYALYDIETAEQYFTRLGKTRPEAIEPGYKVYVKGSESEDIIGYRKGDQWFYPNGTAAPGGNAIFNGGIVYPRYLDRENRVLDIQDPAFSPSYSFEDYKPQLNFMPRLAFSFPISDEAGFFAHYDVLYQRPPSNSTYTALNYFYFNNAGTSIANNTPLNNPNLRPIRTVSYEAGFQQKVSNFAAVKMSAYYKEYKDLIQRRVFTNIPSPISSYETYDNLDFGTTKGFSFQFDKRRTNNLEFSATYTLQFADGSGSDANSSGGINSRGIIRSLSPLSFDERHRFTANMDYRFESGSKYTGPKLGDIPLLAGMGLNVNAIAVSGQPYTRRATAAPFGGSGYLGSINGARLPWNFSLDLRLDKNFEFGLSNKKLGGNVYLRVQNVLDAKNIQSVYSYSGDADNDGYLLSTFGQDRVSDILSSGKDAEAFAEAYSWQMLAPGNYFFPRRMFFGVIFDL